jgi:hypothetical protein
MIPVSDFFMPRYVLDEFGEFMSKQKKAAEKQQETIDRINAYLRMYYGQG